MMNQKDQWSDDDRDIVKKLEEEIELTSDNRFEGLNINKLCDDCKTQHEILNPTDIGCQ